MSDSSSTTPKLDSTNETTPAVSSTTATSPENRTVVSPVVAPKPVTETTAVTEPKSAIVSPLREDLIAPAVSFLASPNVQSADKAKKVAFLQKKGLNQAEIDEAFKRSSEGAVTTATTITNTNPTQTVVSSTPYVNEIYTLVN